MSELAGTDRYGRIWKKGLVYVNNGSDEVLTVLDKVFAVETGKSFYDIFKNGWLHCRKLTKKEIENLPLADFIRGDKPVIPELTESERLNTLIDSAAKELEKNKDHTEKVSSKKDAKNPKKRILDVPEKVSSRRKNLYHLVNNISFESVFKDYNYIYINQDGSVKVSLNKPILLKESNKFYAGKDIKELFHMHYVGNWADCLYSTEELFKLFELSLD